jgi:cytochrome c biogenesis protein CcmG/thiol:disulfide interchange protein DsbE
VTYPLLADPQSALSAEEPFPVLKGMPFFALVGADGKVVHQEFGGIESEQQLVELVRDELGVAL